MARHLTGDAWGAAGCAARSRGRLEGAPALRGKTMDAPDTKPGPADWLSLAAAPAFATMALLTGVLGGGMPGMVCSTAQDAFPLGGMIPMYLLMGVFHTAPWLKIGRAHV